MQTLPPQIVSPRDFRTALGHFATGVAIVTAVSPQGALAGLTINSLTSVSLTPPLVLFCLDKTAGSLAVFQAARGFAVNILTQNQRDLSDRFASHREDRWDGVAWERLETGAPVLPDSLAVLDCLPERIDDGGDHWIFLGRVVRLTIGTGDPLVYFAGGDMACPQVASNQYGFTVPNPIMEATVAASRANCWFS